MKTSYILATLALATSAYAGGLEPGDRIDVTVASPSGLGDIKLSGIVHEAGSHIYGVRTHPDGYVESGRINIKSGLPDGLFKITAPDGSIVHCGYLSYGDGSGFKMTEPSGPRKQFPGKVMIEGFGPGIEIYGPFGKMQIGGTHVGGRLEGSTCLRSSMSSCEVGSFKSGQLHGYGERQIMNFQCIITKEDKGWFIHGTYVGTQTPPIFE